MTYQFNLDLSTANWEVKIDTTANYGYFERNSNGTGGGLYFSRGTEDAQPGQVELTDYDGVSCLSQEVVRALRDAGYYLDDTFDPEPAPAPPVERRK